MGVTWTFRGGENCGKEWKFVCDGIVEKNTEFLERRKVKANGVSWVGTGNCGKELIILRESR